RGELPTRPPWLAPAVALLAAALTAAGPVAAATSRHGAPLLWRVERYGRRSHLFGTVHLPLDLDAALGEEGRAALADAKRVFLEIDTSPDAALTFLLQALHRAELPEKESLHALLRPTAWTRLTTATKGFLPPELLDRLEPWFVALAVVHLAVPPGRPRHAGRRLHRRGRSPAPEGVRPARSPQARACRTAPLPAQPGLVRAPHALAPRRPDVRRRGGGSHVRRPRPGDALEGARVP